MFAVLLISILLHSATAADWKTCDNFCVSAGDQDLLQTNKPNGDSSMFMCKLLCIINPSCSAIEWYDSKWGGSKCKHILTSVPATKCSSGKRWQDAKCVIKPTPTQTCNSKSKNPQGCVGGCAWNHRLQSCEPFDRSTQRMVIASDYQTGGHLQNNEADPECHHTHSGRSNYIFQTKEFCEKEGHRMKDRYEEYNRRLVQMATFTKGQFKCAEEGQNCACEGKVFYGADKRWSDPKEVQGTTICSNGVFGDPAPGTKKECHCFQSKTVSRADGIIMNGDMTVYGHKAEYANQYNLMKEAKKYGMPYLPGWGNHDFGPLMESAAGFGADPDSGTEPIHGRRKLEVDENYGKIRFNNWFEAMFLNENVNNERSYQFMKRFLETFCHGGAMYTGAWNGINIQFAENQCDKDKRLYSYDKKSLGYAVFNKGVLYFQLQKNPSSPDFAMKEHSGFSEYTRFTVEGTGRWFMQELKNVEKDPTVHAIVLNWHWPACVGTTETHDMCDVSFLDKIYRAIGRHNRDYPSQRVIAVFTGHYHNLVGDYTSFNRYDKDPSRAKQNPFFAENGIPVFQSGSFYAGSALDIDIDMASKSFTVSAWGKRDMNSPLQRHCVHAGGKTNKCTVYNFDGTKTEISGVSAEAPWMTRPGVYWDYITLAGVWNTPLTTREPQASCDMNFVQDTGLDCWEEVENGALVPSAFCEGKKCTKKDAQHCCKSAPVNCLRKNECCAAGTTCYGCPQGSAEAVWLDKCWSFARCNKGGNCGKRPGQCCVWGSDCHGCPWGTEYAYPSVCGSSRRCKQFPE